MPPTLGVTLRPPAPIGRPATSRMRSAIRAIVVASSTPAQIAASRSSSSWPTRSSGRSAEPMWRPISRSTRLVAGRPRSSTRRSRPSTRTTTTPAAPEPAGMQRPGEPVEKREAGGKAGRGIDLGRGLRRGPHHVHAAGDPLHLGAVAGDEGRLHRAPATARREQAVLDGLGTRAAHPRAVERHDALAVVGMDQRLHRAAEQGVARHAGELGDERRRVPIGAGRVVHRHERAHAAREQAEALLPRLRRGGAAVHCLQMALRKAHVWVIGARRASLSAASPPASDRARAP